MRICIVGESELAKVIRGHLGKTFAMVESEGQADYTLDVRIEDVPSVVFDSVDGGLERNLYRHIRRLTPTPIETRTAGGVQDESKLVLLVPQDTENQKAVELGVVRGFLDLMNHGDKPITLEAVAVQASADHTAQMKVVLAEACNQMAQLFTGAAQLASREQAKAEYAVISARLDAMLAELRGDQYRAAAEASAYRAQLAEEMVRFQSEIREEMKPPASWVQDAGFWARLWAAICGNVVVVRRGQ
jgi:hypothetical protein